MSETQKRVSNPLTMIAIFSGVAETTTVAVLPFLDESYHQQVDRLVYFAVFYPSAILLLFFITLWLNPVVLYGPGDYKDEQLFIDSVKGQATDKASDDTIGKIDKYWKPDGSKINALNSAKIRAWLKSQNIDASITSFIHVDEYKEFRARIIEDLNISSEG